MINILKKFGNYEIGIVEEDGINIYKLMDLKNEMIVELVPFIGSNIITVKQKNTDIIKGPSNLKELISKPTQYGIPLLFPANRLKNGELHFNDEKYQFPLNNGEDHIHGEISKQPWGVASIDVSDEKGIVIISELNLRDIESIYNYFPFCLRFTMEVVLFDGSLNVEITIKNEGEGIAPFSFGLHPYFALQTSDDSDSVLHLPANKEWPLLEGFVDGFPSQSTICKKLNKGLNLNELPPKKGYNLLELKSNKNEPHRTVLCNKKQNTKISFDFDSKFMYAALFRPSWFNAVSIEPYTSLTNCFDLPLPMQEILQHPIYIDSGVSYRYNYSLKIKN